MRAAFALFPAFRDRNFPMFDRNHFVAINSGNSRFMKGYIKCGFSFWHRGFFWAARGGGQAQISSALPVASCPPAASDSGAHAARSDPHVAAAVSRPGPLLGPGTQGEGRGSC